MSVYRWGGGGEGSLEYYRALWGDQVNQYVFSRVFGIANQLLIRNSPFAPLGQVDE